MDWSMDVSAVSTLVNASLNALQTFFVSLELKLTTSTAIASAVLAATSAQAKCPDYTTYSLSPQGNPSNGALGLPFMRPDPACRTFSSSAVEDVISNMTARLKDPDVARMFENTFPNTLDTTIKYFNATENLAFIITGDITAQWLRDTGNQFAPYHSLLPLDSDLQALVKAVINNEARYVSQYPYCGAFQPPPESGLAPSYNSYAYLVEVNPPTDGLITFECKFELDSLCAFIKLSRRYYQATNDSSIMNDEWFTAVDQILTVIEEQSQASFNDDSEWISYYNWTGLPGSLSPAVPNGGNGEPHGSNGLVATHHRPSDDLSVFAFLTPANAMLSVELAQLADALDSAGLAQNISAIARNYSSIISNAVWNTTLVDNVFAYETNGLGSRYVMDDANVPSLLSLPYLGFLSKQCPLQSLQFNNYNSASYPGISHPAYQATKQVIWSRSNPYYVTGQNFSGIGGPHVDAWNPWPMSQVSRIFGSDDDDEIMTALYTIVNNTDGLGLMHESISIYDESDYTRQWFAWANSYFAEMLLDLAQRKPYLIFKTNESYVPGE